AMILAGCRQLHFASLLGYAGHLLVLSQLPGFAGGDFEPTLKPIQAGSLHRLSDKRTERCIFGVDRALKVFGDGGRRFLDLPRSPLRGGLPSDDLFRCAL
ncbi:hypothetical protein, partial [Mesorhizobium sp. M5C.F.Ca.ET.164.01.1.1]|uniref:hypothetical protein n=1 Tax=Mesorhizobium sp. M5C.F.Ca.ET.164.01.1.1 TaxID=2563957 RepID=UPI00167C268F